MVGRGDAMGRVKDPEGRATDNPNINHPKMRRDMPGPDDNRLSCSAGKITLLPRMMAMAPRTVTATPPKLWLDGKMMAAANPMTPNSKTMFSIKGDSRRYQVSIMDWATKRSVATPTNQGDAPLAIMEYANRVYPIHCMMSVGHTM